MEQSNLKYIHYARKSEDDKKRQVLSLEGQTRECKEFALSVGLKIVGNGYLTETQSAYKPNRPVFREMISKIKSGEANAILTWKPDRLARNPQEGGELLQLLQDGVIKEIRTPYEIYRTEDVSFLPLHLQFGMSNEYSRQISANVKRGIRQKYERGEYVGRAPTGFKNIKIGLFKNIAPVEEVKDRWIKLLNLAATGDFSLGRLIEVAEEIGLKTNTGYKIYKQTLSKILKDPVWYGSFRHGGSVHPGTFGQVLRKDLWDKIQEAMSNRSKPKKIVWTHPFKGTIKCAECGCSITAETKQKHYKGTDRDAEYIYYRCTKRRGNCSQPGVTSEDLNKQIIERVKKIKIDKEVWELGIELLKEKHKKESDDRLKQVQANQRQCNEIQEKLNCLLELRIAGEIQPDEYANKKAEYQQLQNQLQERLRDSEGNSKTWLELAEEFFEVAYTAKQILESKENFEKKRNILKAIGWNLVLKDKQLVWTYREPYDILLQPAYRLDVRRRRDSNSRELALTCFPSKRNGPLSDSSG
jgi:site-specific DNA recombinase